MFDSLLALARRILPSRLYERLFGGWDPEGLRKYSKNAGWMLFARLSSLLVSFFVSIYVIRYLGPHNYGLLSYAVSFVSIFGFLASLGIEQILYRDLVNHPEKERELMGSALFLKLIGGFIATALAIATASFAHPEGANLLLIWIVAMTFLFHPWQIIAYAYQARVESKYPSLIAFGISLILAAAKLGVIFLDKGILYFGFVLLLEAILYAALYVAFYSKQIENVFAWRFDPGTARSLLRDSLPLMFSTVSILIYSRIDQVMIGHYFEASSVGIYDAAVRLSDIWYIIPNVLIASFFPAMLNAKKTSTERYVKRIRSLAVLLVCLCAVIAIPATLLAEPLVSLLFGEAYLGSTGVLRIYIWSIAGFSLGALANHYLVAENWTHIFLVISVATMLLNVVLNILLIPALGINGAALATLISYSLIPLLPFLWKRVRMQFRAAV